jgi:hypothetical protein
MAPLPHRQVASLLGDPRRVGVRGHAQDLDPCVTRPGSRRARTASEARWSPQ